jgi:hypothetical protein
MLFQASILSLLIAVLVAATHSQPIESHSNSNSSHLGLAIKTFIISFLVIYFGIPYMIPAIAPHVGGGQVIEVGEPDF